MFLNRWEKSIEGMTFQEIMRVRKKIMMITINNISLITNIKMSLFKNHCREVVLEVREIMWQA